MGEVVRRSVYGNRPVEQSVPTVNIRPELTMVPTARPEPSIDERIGAYVIPAEDGGYYVHEGLLSDQVQSTPAATTGGSRTVITRRVTEEYEISGNGAMLPGQALSLFSASPTVQPVRQNAPEVRKQLGTTSKEGSLASPNRLTLKGITASRLGRVGVKMTVAVLAAGAAGYLPYKLASEFGTIGGGYDATVGNYVGDVAGPVVDFISSKLPSNQEAPSDE